MLPVVSDLFFSPVTIDTLVNRLAFPLGRLICFIIIGLAAGQVIEGFGWTRQVAVVARPFFRFSRMGDLCSTAFTTAFFSGAAANAMLAEFYDQAKISKTQFSCPIIDHFHHFLHLPTDTGIHCSALTMSARWVVFSAHISGCSDKNHCLFAV
ncbi:MAG: hypothetical protein U5K27_02675 [Desulfotignum sp.]|nr:hypothetical protein [Desulfotignum sp.]